MFFVLFFLCVGKLYMEWWYKNLPIKKGEPEKETMVDWMEPTLANGDDYYNLKITNLFPDDVDTSWASMFLKIGNHLSFEASREINTPNSVSWFVHNNLVDHSFFSIRTFDADMFFHQSIGVILHDDLEQQIAE